MSAGTGYWKPKTLGIKKSLVFYAGKAPRGVKTNWIMHEYRLPNVDRSAAAGKKNNNMRLDDWVLCRIYNNKGSIEKHFPSEQKLSSYPEMEDQKPNILMHGQNITSISQQQQQPLSSMVNDELLQTDASVSVPRLQTDSSSSGQVLSPEVTWEKEVQSQPNGVDFGFQDDPFASQVQYQVEQLSPLQDMFMYLQQPF
ncbi:hypothetical protein F3Y22_tig00112400pilonHSYRG00049 [Hibiscus syriacus]|uniref:NAC domain-containing protein n=1 Tax=Hibiscus syriacus TaxID=106335 RepID=A0A6A2Y4W9_HIBSY|nr:hypothetical protein F3Y22_tig00112400pilonHSYRG00049 [Hibiscus syriacus]